MSSIYLVRSGDKWLRKDHHLYFRVLGDEEDWSMAFVADLAGAASFATRELAAEEAQTCGGEPVEFREERGHEQAYKHALDCVDRVFQVGGQPEPPLLPDFCQLNDDKFLAVIRLAEEFVKQRQALVAARNEVEKLSRKLKAAEK